MKRETENVMLLLVGISVGLIAITGVYARYVKPTMQPWLIVSAVMLIALALAAIVRDVRRESHESADGGHDHHDHPDGNPHHPDDHDHPDDGHAHRPGIAWLLIVPVALLAFIVPPAITPKVTATVTDVTNGPLSVDFPPLPPGRAPELPLADFSARVTDDSAGTLNNRLVTVTAYTDELFGRPVLSRVTIMCCAADATLTTVRAGGPGAAELSALPGKTWVKVEGGAAPRPPGTSRTEMPVLDVTSVQVIPEPKYPYAYN